jgi:hypothetical protein
LILFQRETHPPQFNAKVSPVRFVSHVDPLSDDQSSKRQIRPLAIPGRITQ